jgi:hypothetical protein
LQLSLCLAKLLIHQPLLLLDLEHFFLGHCKAVPQVVSLNLQLYE